MYIRFNSRNDGNSLFARKELKKLILTYKGSRFEIFRDFTSLLEKFEDPIVNSFIMVEKIGNGKIYDARLSNALIKSINRKVKNLKRLSRSFRNFKHFHNRFLFTTRQTPILNETTDYNPVTYYIDEFKGNIGGKKYPCILVNPMKHSVLDILSSRSQTFLSFYFREIPKAERYRIKFFVCDMWRPYTGLAKAFFPNVTIIIDKYHFIRQTTWAVESVRKRLLKAMTTSLRKYYKRIPLILTRYNKLKDENKRACDLMLLYNDDLRLPHYLKEWFYRICQNPKYSE